MYNIFRAFIFILYLATCFAITAVPSSIIGGILSDKVIKKKIIKQYCIFFTMHLIIVIYRIFVCWKMLETILGGFWKVKAYILLIDANQWPTAAFKSQGNQPLRILKISCKSKLDLNITISLLFFFKHSNLIWGLITRSCWALIITSVFWF